MANFPELYMKNRLHHILILACIATAAFATASYGQDSGIPDYEMTDSERDKMLYSPGGEGELRPRYPATVTNTAPKDSASFNRPVTPPARLKPEQAPAKSPDKQQPPKHDDDSILSFNFLYYIIQKYKLQDIID